MPCVAFIWHAAVLPAYRKLLEEVHAVSGADLHLIVPPKWPEAGRDHSAPAGRQAGYWTHVLPAWFIGRHYLYFMPGLARALRAISPDLIYCYAGAYWVITFWTLWIVRHYLPGTRVVFVSDQTLFKRYPIPFSWMERWVLRHADFATSCDAEGIRRLGEKGFPAERAAPVPLGFDGGMFYAETSESLGLASTRRRPLRVNSAAEEDAESTQSLGHDDRGRTPGKLLQQRAARFLSSATPGVARRPEARVTKGICDLGESAGQEAHGTMGAKFPERGESMPLRILYAGRLLEMKGLTDLIDACARLDLHYELDIAGEGPQREALEERAQQLGVDAGFRGAMPSESVAGLMRQSDVLVLPSRTIAGKWKEQFGRVLVEAMACGCVPVGSDSGAIPSVIGPAGLTFPEGDIAALAGCLSELAENRTRLLDLRQRGLERARERYSWQAVARQLWSTVERAMALPGRY
jgi:glycosyltransferase involved in cell wall biosynthesis